MTDIKAARTKYDVREEARKFLGEPEQHSRNCDQWNCPTGHDHNSPSFTVYDNGYQCFGCGIRGDIFDFFVLMTGKPLADILRGEQIDPLEELRRKQEYQEREIERLKKRVEEHDKAIEDIRETVKHMQYYEMGGDGVALWEGRGVPKWYQDFVYLGYDPAHNFFVGDKRFTSPSLTIPYYEAGTRDVVDIRHRVLQSDDFRYLPERPGLGQNLYVANPDDKLAGPVVLCEGEIKAMVTWVTADGPQVVATPSKTPKPDLFGLLKDCEPVYYIPDPDAGSDTIKHVSEHIGDRLRVARLPEKIDDMITGQHLGKDWIGGVLKSARKVR